jgi:TRAP-type C4-dicarboxylate transport system permease small subunit
MDLMLIVSRWLIEASVIPSDIPLTTTATQTISMDLIGVTILVTSVGMVLFILVVVIRRFRKAS